MQTVCEKKNNNKGHSYRAFLASIATQCAVIRTITLQSYLSTKHAICKQNNNRIYIHDVQLPKNMII